MRGAEKLSGLTEAQPSAELDELARITPADIARAQETWRRHASPAFRGLLDATPMEEPTVREVAPLPQ